MTKSYTNVNGVTVDTSAVTLPSNRKFRDAWKLNGDVVEVDMAKAKVIHANKIRAERMSRFAPYDKVATPLMRKAAMTTLSQWEKDTLAIADADAQKLRDAPTDARIAAAKTSEELEALTLDVLTG